MLLCRKHEVASTLTSFGLLILNFFCHMVCQFPVPNHNTGKFINPYHNPWPKNETGEYLNHSPYCVPQTQKSALIAGAPSSIYMYWV